jgi:hypothetical protein
LFSQRLANLCNNDSPVGVQVLEPYNLSCYACQMNNLDTSRDWFKRAVANRRQGRHQEIGA